MVSASRIAVGTAATALNSASTAGLRLLIKNGSTVIALGDSGVTAATGSEIAASASAVVELQPGDVLYGRTASGTSAVQVLVT